MGRKKINLDYKKIAEEYLEGENLKNLASKYGVSQWTLLARFKELGIRKTTKRKLNKQAFSEFTPGSCYWAGFIAADGWISRGYHCSIELSIKDEPHLEKIRTFLHSSANITTHERVRFGSNLKSARIQFNSVELVNDLKNNFNITSNKSLSYAPPVQIPNNLLGHFIRGYIDGDGSIGWHKHNNKPRLNICSGSKELLEWIFKIIKNNVKQVGNPSILPRPNSNLNTIEFIGHQVYRVLEWLYQDAEHYLDRKFEVYNSWQLTLPAAHYCDHQLAVAYQPKSK